MDTNIFLGNNVGQLPLTHCGSIYLMPEQSTFGLLGQKRFEKFVYDWCSSIGSVDLFAGAIERGRIKGVNHIQWVAAADDSLQLHTKNYLGARELVYYTDKKLVKSADEYAISGFTDKFHQVQGVKIKGSRAVVSIEKIVDKISASDYAFKFAKWGLNTIYYIKT